MGRQGVTVWKTETKGQSQLKPWNEMEINSSLPFRPWESSGCSQEKHMVCTRWARFFLFLISLVIPVWKTSREALGMWRAVTLLTVEEFSGPSWGACSRHMVQCAKCRESGRLPGGSGTWVGPWRVSEWRLEGGHSMQKKVVVGQASKIYSTRWVLKTGIG